MTVRARPTLVNAPHLVTPADLASLQRTRARALEVFSVAGATIERLTNLHIIDDRVLGLAILTERLAREALEAIDALCAALAPPQPPEPEPTE